MNGYTKCTKGVFPVAEIKITKPTFKKTEAEWFNYHKTVKEIKLLEDAILHPYNDTEDVTIVKGYTSVNEPGDPTAITAIRLTRHKQLNYLREIASAIETVYNELPKEQKRLVHVRYWSNKNLTWDGIADELKYGRRTVIRWRDAIVLATIEVLGWR